MTYCRTLRLLRLARVNVIVWPDSLYDITRSSPQPSKIFPHRYHFRSSHNVSE